MTERDLLMLDLAEALAYHAHHGQTRNDGVTPYIVHPQRVARRVVDLGHEAEAVAWLHDVIEDTPVTAATLLAVGLPMPVVDAVVELTRHEGTSYRDDIARLVHAGSDLALQVKLADIRDNSTDGPGDVWPRYIDADIKIRTELERRGVTPVVKK